MNPTTNSCVKKYHNLIFDLDGTLTDPKEGIVKSLQHALDRFSLPPCEDSKLAAFIGEPLHQIFSALLASHQQELIPDLIATYRERYSQVGMFENTVYPDIENLLEQLTASQQFLFIATTKPRHFAIQILKHFKLDHYFVNIYGAFLDGRMSDKSELVKFIIDSHKIEKPSLMIGDRKFDIVAARNNHLDSLGVLYGYGTEEELKSTQPNYLAATPFEIMNVVAQ